MKEKLISIIIPVFNEEKNVPLVLREVLKVEQKLIGKYFFEVIFVNDGSCDKSAIICQRLSEKYSRVKYLEFSRNFGKELATTAGLSFCLGDAAVMLDADLQHPPKTIPNFLKKWEEGFLVVVGVRKNGNGKGFWGNLISKIFYFIMNLIGETNLMPSSSDFRLIDRRVIDEFKRFSEHGRITRGLIDWLGFEKAFVEFNVDKRKFGEPSYSKIKLLHLAMSSFVSHSLFPLKLAGYLGSIITLLSGTMGLFIFFEKYVFADAWNLNFSGSAILAVIILFLVGVILSCLGLVALYIGNIYQEVLARPLFVISRKKNF